MTASMTWADAEAALKGLTPCELEALRQIARLPFIHVQALAQLGGLGDRSSSVGRSVRRLTDRGLIAHVQPAITAGPIALHYVTDRGLATLAVDWDVEVEDLARKLRIDRRSLNHLHLRARQTHHTYKLLGAVAESGGDEPRLLAWEQPWLRSTRDPGAHSETKVELPARALLTWPNTGSGSFLLAPDISKFPVQAYRPTLLHLMRWRESDEPNLSLVVIATEHRRRAAAIDALASEVREQLGVAPLMMVVATWSDLAFVLPSAIAQWVGTAEQELKRDPVAPRKHVSVNHQVPPVVGSATPCSALSNSRQADMEMLTMIGRHPFIPLADIGVLMGSKAAVGRRRCRRLIADDLVRIVGQDEIGDDAASHRPLELTRLGIGAVAAWHGLPQRDLTRLKLLLGRSTKRSSRSRAELIRRFTHTQGVNRFFVELGRLAMVSRRAGWNDGIIDWQGLPISQQNRPRPDAYGIYRHRGLDYGFFLEYDRGTERAKQYERKLRGYYDFRDSGRFQRQFEGMPTILFVTTSSAAEKRIERAACITETRRGSSLPILLTHEPFVETQPKGILGRVWRQPGTQRRGEWLIGTVEEAVGAGTAGAPTASTRHAS